MDQHKDVECVLLADVNPRLDSDLIPFISWLIERAGNSSNCMVDESMSGHRE